MKTQEYLDLARSALGLPSDYALQKPLALSKSQLSKYRTGKDSLSTAVALRIAKVVKKDPLQIVAEVNLERDNDPETRAFWESILEKISSGFDWLLSGAGPHGIRLSMC